MERILRAFKGLFMCENPVKKHFMYILLMFLPCLAGSFLTYIDKDTPSEAVFLLLALFAFFLLLSIVPMFMLAGFGVEFYKDRFDGKLGIPAISFELFNKGLQVFPLCLVWCFYAMLIVSIPIFLFVISIVALKDNVAGLLGTIVLSFILLTLLSIVLMVLSPFVSYIFISFAKNMEYKSEYFNPFKIVEYIKLAFKDTMLVMLKMIVAGMVVNMAASILSLIFVLAGAAIGIVGALLAPEGQVDTYMYTPVMILLMMPVISLSMLLQSYSQSIVGFATADQYFEIYKNKIEPVEI